VQHADERSVGPAVRNFYRDNDPRQPPQGAGDYRWTTAEDGVRDDFADG
jgi:hypothetical protein